ncbi:MAG TPA: MlaD family protein [Polyangiaceae bacterium]|jgi:paraquat-inducible protein B
MPEPEQPKAPEPTKAKVKRHARLSPTWLIPLVAAGLVAYLAYSWITSHGSRVTLLLDTADGLTPDQTTVKHKAVTVGTVEGIRLTDDLKGVIVQIRMAGRTDAMLTNHARFWVVRPRISAGNLSGLETIVSGAYIEVDPGEPGGRRQTEFKALSQPPGRQSDEPGKVFVLEAKRLGSLSSGSPVYYRDVEVGEVLGFDLGSGLGPVTLRAFVRDPYDKLVHVRSRFWNTSGVSVTMGPEGMRVEVESIQSLVSGGIAFETPTDTDEDAEANESSRFELYDGKADAENAFYREKIPYVTYFRTSVQGLSAGSPVQISGVQVGNVTDVRLVYDAANRGMIARVAFALEPERLLVRGAANDATVTADVRKAFSDKAMRVRLESSNLITGSKDLAIEYAKDKVTAELPREQDALVLPSEGGGIDSLTASLADVASKLDKVPFAQIGDHADAVLANLQHLVTEIDTDARPALAQLPGIATQMSLFARNANGTLGSSGYGPNSEFQHDMERLLREVNDTARSFRTLADYLDRHPEALIRGRSSQASGR